MALGRTAKFYRDNPEARKSGPSIEVFQSGRALKAENSIPV